MSNLTSYALTFGPFGGAVAAELQTLGACSGASPWSPRGASQPGVRRWFLLASALHSTQLQQMWRALLPGATLQAVLVHERFIFVSPRLASGTLCAGCYTKRLLSHPPAGASSEAMSICSRFVEHTPEFAYAGLHPGLARYVARLCVADVHTPSTARRSLVVDIASLTARSVTPLPLHGCSCGSVQRPAQRAPARFVDFAKQLNLESVGPLA